MIIENRNLNPIRGYSGVAPLEGHVCVAARVLPPVLGVKGRESYTAKLDTLVVGVLKEGHGGYWIQGVELVLDSIGSHIVGSERYTISDDMVSQVSRSSFSVADLRVVDGARNATVANELKTLVSIE
jgi:hypothetical protein